MAKYISLPGMCATHNRPLGFQFQQDGDYYVAVGSFSVTGGNALGGDAVKVNGRFVNSSRFSCKYCGNNAMHPCGNCHTVFCIKEGATEVTCPKCGTVTTLEWVDDLEQVDRSSADVAGQ